MKVRRQIDITGIVQGVGFRPYVYRLATERHLAGTINNTPTGVTIEVQGPHEAVEDFVARLPQEPPPLARITNVAVLCPDDVGSGCPFPWMIYQTAIRMKAHPLEANVKVGDTLSDIEVGSDGQHDWIHGRTMTYLARA